jgi:hypothetical protein
VVVVEESRRARDKEGEGERRGVVAASGAVAGLARAAAPVAVDAAAGLVGGACCVLVGHPLDTAKVLMQAQPGRVVGGSSTLRCLVDVLRTRGVVKGWYAGGGAALAANAAENSLLFMSYNQIKGGVDEALASLDVAAERKTFAAGAVAGGLGSLVTSVALCPIEMIKMRMQTGESAGISRCAADIVRASGLRGLFKGFGATVMREAPGNVAFFGTYEASLALLRRHGVFGTDDARVLTAGGMGGVGFWLVALPADAVKTQQQTSSAAGGFAAAARAIKDQHGLRGFYRGLAPVLLRAFPSNAALFWGVSKTQSFFNDGMGLR